MSDYILRQNTEDGNIIETRFTVPDEQGTYKLTATLADGSKKDMGNIAVGSTANEYKLKLRLQNSKELSVNFTTKALQTTPESNLDSITWDEISRISKAGTAKQLFNLGDTKNIVLNDSTIIPVAIMGFDHDYASFAGDEKIGITFGTIPNIYGGITCKGTASDITMALNTMCAKFPVDLRNVLRTCYKLDKKGNRSNTTGKNLWLFAQVELTGVSHQAYENEGTLYPYGGTLTRKIIGYTGTAADKPRGYWLRTTTNVGEYQVLIEPDPFTANDGKLYDGYISYDYGNELGFLNVGFCV